MTAPSTHTANLRQKLQELEAQYSKLCAELAAADARAQLPGVFVVIEVEGQRALIPGPAIQEVVRLVHCAPLPDSPRWVLGSFDYRGRPVIAIDLARYLGRTERLASLDAHVLLLSGGGTVVGLMVDRVLGLVEGVTALDANGELGDSNVFAKSALVSSLCRAGDEMLPLLRLGRLIETLPLSSRSEEARG